MNPPSPLPSPETNPDDVSRCADEVILEPQGLHPYTAAHISAPLKYQMTEHRKPHSSF